MGCFGAGELNARFIIGVASITHITYVRTKIVTFKGGHLMWLNVISLPKGTVLKGKTFLPVGAIFSFKRSSH